MKIVIEGSLKKLNNIETAKERIINGMNLK